MTTARELISDALGDIGVLDPIETMTAESAAHGLRTLNRILDSWSAQRLMCYASREIVASFAGPATIGPAAGATISSPDVPLRILPGCYYVLSGISYPLQVWTVEQYNAVTYKGLSTQYPQGLTYDRQHPLGTIRVWPVPSVPIEYHLMTLQPLAAFSDLDTDHDLPAGYRDALFYALCVRLPAAYNLQASPLAVQQLRSAMSVLRVNNTTVPRLSTVGEGSGRYSVTWNGYN